MNSRKNSSTDPTGAGLLPAGIIPAGAANTPVK